MRVLSRRHRIAIDADSHPDRTIVGPSAGDMIGEVALAIEMGCDEKINPRDFISRSCFHPAS